jgi:hypothetical protein
MPELFMRAPTWVSAEEAGEALEVGQQTLWTWRTAGCPYLDGRKIRSRRTDADPAQYEYRRIDVERIAATPPHRGKYEDSIGTWLTIEGASAQYGLHRSSLENWCRRGCPFLGGRKPRFRKQTARTPGQKAGHVTFLVFLEEDLKAIVAARATGELPEKDADQWLEIAECNSRFGFNRAQLKEWSGEGCAFLSGAKLQFRPRIALRADGRPMRRQTFALEQLKQIEQARASVPGNSAEGEWLTYEEAHNLFGFSRGMLYTWHDQGSPFLGGKKLAARRQHRRVRGRLCIGMQAIWTYYLPDLEVIAQARKTVGDDSCRDEAGNWLTAEATGEKYGIWSASLSDWRDRPCPFLGGRTVRAQQVKRVAGSTDRRMRWVYLEEDLRQIAAAQKIAAARGSSPAVYSDDQGTWLFASEVHKRFGLPADGLWYYRKKTFPFLANGKLRAKPVAASHHPKFRTKKPGKQCWVYHEQDLQRIAAARAGLPVEPLQPPAEVPSAGAKAQPTNDSETADSQSEYPGHQKKPYRTGVRPDPFKEAVLKLCYDRYIIAGASRKKVLRECKTCFGDAAPCDEKGVANDAKRWAQRFEPPLPLVREEAVIKFGRTTQG